MEKYQLNSDPQYNISSIIYLIICLGLGSMLYAAIAQHFSLFLTISLFPFLLIALSYTLTQPLFCFMVFFTGNYFIMTLFRYTGSTGFSIIIDLLIGCTFLITIIQSSLYDNIQWKRIINPISLGTLIWLIYTFLEVLNPTSKFEAWVSTRQLIYGSFAIVIITSIIFTKKEHVFRNCFEFIR